MEFVDEPAERVESQLAERGITVRREPYDPRNRSLFSDFLGFLRSPSAGSTVTLFEDEEGKVRYYTVARPDPEVETLRTRVEELSQATGALEPARLERIEQRLAAVDVLEQKVEAIPTIEQKLEALPALEARLEALPALEAKVEALPALEAKVEGLTGLETKVTQLEGLRTRIDRLERPR